jgi:hypothetical protein
MTKLSKSHCMHRRTVLLRGLIGAAAAGLSLEAATANSFKATKKQAGYINRNKPATQMCVRCGFYIEPYDCVIVEGPVSPWGWCNYYED